MGRVGMPRRGRGGGGMNLFKSRWKTAVRRSSSVIRRDGDGRREPCVDRATHNEADGRWRWGAELIDVTYGRRSSTGSRFGRGEPIFVVKNSERANRKKHPQKVGWRRKKWEEFTKKNGGEGKKRLTMSGNSDRGKVWGGRGGGKEAAGQTVK